MTKKSCVREDSIIRETRRIHVYRCWILRENSREIFWWTIWNSCVRHNSFICTTWCMHAYRCWISHDDSREIVDGRLGIHVRDIPAWDMTPVCKEVSRFAGNLRMCDLEFMCKTWLVYVWDTTHSCKQVLNLASQFAGNLWMEDLEFMRETWLIYMWDTTHSCKQVLNLASQFAGNLRMEDLEFMRETWLIYMWD